MSVCPYVICVSIYGYCRCVTFCYIQMILPKLICLKKTKTLFSRFEEVKSLLMRVKEESKISGLKLYIKKTEIMAFSPIPSWQIDGGEVC